MSSRTDADFKIVLSPRCGAYFGIVLSPRCGANFWIVVLGLWSCGLGRPCQCYEFAN
jgi:hypothetical protein